MCHRVDAVTGTNNERGDHLYGGAGPGSVQGGKGYQPIVGLMHAVCDLFTLCGADGLLRYPLPCLRTQRMTTKTNHQDKLTQACWRTRRLCVPARLRARGLGACGAQPALHQHRGLHANSVASANGLRRSGTATRHVCGFGGSAGVNSKGRNDHFMRVAGLKEPGMRMDAGNRAFSTTELAWLA